MIRWVRFFVAILAGIGLGLLYGWQINAVQYVDTTIDTLRFDYQTDYVLMVAETHSLDSDLPLALSRLSALGNAPAERIVQQALLDAEKLGYADVDVARLQTFLESILAAQPASAAGDSP